MKNVIVVNSKKLDEKIKLIKRDGPKKFHVLTDFDRTLTKNFYKNEKAYSIVSQFASGDYLENDYKRRAKKLFEYYHPFEVDYLMPLSKRKEKMQEWWGKHLDLLIEYGLTKEIIKNCIKDMIKGDKLVIRKGVNSFLVMLGTSDIPLIIITSGLGDLVKEYMCQAKVLTKNISIVGNNFKFNSKGRAIGYKKIIHVFSKNEFELHHMPVYKELLKRRNVILIGDSIGDLSMVEGFQYEEIIKIGFLNENVDSNLEIFKSSYDVVILNDSDFGPVNSIINRLFSEERNVM